MACVALASVLPLASDCHWPFTTTRANVCTATTPRLCKAHYYALGAHYNAVVGS